MLRISKLADYGIVIMSFLVKHPKMLLTASDVAEKTHIRRPTVAKLLKILSEKQLLDSRRGVQGGYFLSRSPEKINLADIITAVDGPIAITQCVHRAEACDQAAVCSLKDNWLLVNDVIYKALREVSLEAISYSMGNLKGIPVISQVRHND